MTWVDDMEWHFQGFSPFFFRPGFSHLRRGLWPWTGQGHIASATSPELCHTPLVCYNIITSNSQRKWRHLQIRWWTNKKLHVDVLQVNKRWLIKTFPCIDPSGLTLNGACRHHAWEKYNTQRRRRIRSQIQATENFLSRRFYGNQEKETTINHRRLQRISEATTNFLSPSKLFIDKCGCTLSTPNPCTRSIRRDDNNNNMVMRLASWWVISLSKFRSHPAKKISTVWKLFRLNPKNLFSF